MCGWEECAQNGIPGEAGCVGGRREHKMVFGGRPLDAWVGGGSTKWDLAGGRWMCGWEEGAQKGGGGRMGMGEGKRVGEHKRQIVSLGGLELGMSRWKIHQNQTKKFWENQPSGNPSVTTTAFGFFRW
jgi:hypothetical protein